MTMSLAECTRQLDAEQRLLIKANADIEDGRQRVYDQQARVRELQADGHDIRQAERLVELLKQTLTEWERHRTLIEARVLHLRHEADQASRDA
ncbi:hypothetical protein GGD66_007890 [Bradyrhizobium sp. CIR48]|uniref:hypothetical protein n=1 Tax=unclassified Bradyrhizobium TaxID=2631580 RepID=UPI001605EEE7|nr:MULTISPECIES: hypothetical protein [unclassified Bradyrhizobium]MBB4366199.1 hypothetical protein [Bradyrhizobium sp. CIR18]MBB4381751.1 hypothetical protein [Bradyrhizobium sp. SBR1B]MBB4429288.1 hypothetical protein [Bradyrhizobium sp. CIR48]